MQIKKEAFPNGCIKAEQASTNSHQSDIMARKFSNDDKYLISGSLDKTIKIWDFSTGKLLNTLTGNTGGINGWRMLVVLMVTTIFI